MAKDKKADKASKKTEAKADKAEAKEHKFGVTDLAEKLGIKEASVRVQLRNKGIEKDGKSYGWDTKAELQDVVDQLKASTKGDDDGEKSSKKSKKADKADDGKKAKKDKKGKKAKKDDDD